MKLSLAQRTSAAAFTLVEVALAMGVASFCLIAVLGLVPLGVDTSQMASDQTTASSILTHVLSDLRATPMASPPGTKAATSSEYAVQIPANVASTTGSKLSPIYFGDSAQQFSASQSSNTSRYRLTITVLPSTGGRAATQVSLLVSWPARVDPTDRATGITTGRVQVFAALDRN